MCPQLFLNCSLQQQVRRCIDHSIPWMISNILFSCDGIFTTSRTSSQDKPIGPSTQCSNSLSRHCPLPTALGKTSVWRADLLSRCPQLSVYLFALRTLSLFLPPKTNTSDACLRGWNDSLCRLAAVSDPPSKPSSRFHWHTNSWIISKRPYASSRLPTHILWGTEC